MRFTGPRVRREITIELREQKQNLNSSDSQYCSFRRAERTVPCVGEVKYLGSNPGRKERKYGNQARTPPAPASSAPGWGRSRERGSACTGLAISENWRARARPERARALHASGAEQGLLAPGRIFPEVWVSSLRNRLDSFPWATVRYLFNLAVQPPRGRQGGREAGRRKAGGVGERKGKPFLPSAQAAAVSPPHGVPPGSPRP